MDTHGNLQREIFCFRTQKHNILSTKSRNQNGGLFIATSDLFFRIAMDGLCPKLAEQLATVGPLNAEMLRALLDSKSMVKLFEEASTHIGHRAKSCPFSLLCGYGFILDHCNLSDYHGI